MGVNLQEGGVKGEMKYRYIYIGINNNQDNNLEIN